MRTLRHAAQLTVITVAEVAILVALVAAGRRPELRVPLGHLGAWLHHGDPATVVVALARGVAMLGTGWLLASTLLYLAASIGHVPAAVGALRWATIPAVRRVVDAACAVSVASTIVLAPGVAAASRAADAPSVTLVRDGRGDRPIAALPPDPAPTPPRTTPAMPPAEPVAHARPTPAPPVPIAGEIVVVEGDNLWSIAAARVALARGVDVADLRDADVAPYWLQVCDSNHDRLRSGDPNLIHPGERVVLPPVS